MAIDTAAKKDWLDSFRGATLILQPILGNPKVNHMMTRNFDLVGRNCFFVSVRCRVILGEEKVALAEKHIYDRIEEVKTALLRKIEAAKAIMRDANITTLANYNRATTHTAVVVSPVQKRYIEVLQLSDDLLKLLSTLMLHGEIPEREHSKRELEIKHLMRIVPSAVRKITIGLRNHLQTLSEDEKAKAEKLANGDDGAPDNLDAAPEITDAAPADGAASANDPSPTSEPLAA